MIEKELLQNIRKQQVSLSSSDDQEDAEFIEQMSTNVAARKAVARLMKLITLDPLNLRLLKESDCQLIAQLAERSARQLMMVVVDRLAEAEANK